MKTKTHKIHTDKNK